jgi:hypothetical protein
MPKITSTDSLDLNNLPAELLANLITVGDKVTLLVNPEHTANDGGVSVTPIVFNSAGTIVLAVLEKKTSTMSGAALFRRGASSGPYVSAQLQWDVTGASKIGLHITTITGTSNGILLRTGVV